MVQTISHLLNQTSCIFKWRKFAENLPESKAFSPWVTQMISAVQNWPESGSCDSIWKCISAKRKDIGTVLVMYVGWQPWEGTKGMHIRESQLSPYRSCDSTSLLISYGLRVITALVSQCIRSLSFPCLSLPCIALLFTFPHHSSLL